WRGESAPDQAPALTAQPSATVHEEIKVRIDRYLENSINSEFGLELGQRLSNAQLRTLERVTHLEPNILEYDGEGNLVLHLPEQSQESTAGSSAESESVRAGEDEVRAKFRTTLETLVQRYKSEDSGTAND